MGRFILYVYLLGLVVAWIEIAEGAAALASVTAVMAAAMRFVFGPHVEKTMYKATQPIRDDLGELKTGVYEIRETIARELAPNGTPMAMKVARIEGFLRIPMGQEGGTGDYSRIERRSDRQHDVHRESDHADEHA